MYLSSLFLKEFTVLAVIISAGSLFQKFTTPTLKKLDLCKIPVFNLALYIFIECPLVLLLSLSDILKKLSYFTFSFPVIIL